LQFETDPSSRTRADHNRDPANANPQSTRLRHDVLPKCFVPVTLDQAEETRNTAYRKTIQSGSKRTESLQDPDETSCKIAKQTKPQQPIQCLNSSPQNPTAKTALSATNPETSWCAAKSIRIPPSHRQPHHRHNQHRHRIQTTTQPTIQQRQQYHLSNQAPGISSAPAPAGSASAAALSMAILPRAGRGIGMGACGRISMRGLVLRFRGG
jgi:hypothetical protein